ncbi:MAG TPA: phosphatase PAP2 family protein [Catenuloplanes sp.]
MIDSRTSIPRSGRHQSGRYRSGRHRPGWSRWPELPFLAGFVVLTALLAGGALLDVDLAVRDWCDSHRPEWARLVARGLNFAGSASLLAGVLLVAAGVVGFRRRSVRPVLRVLVTLAASYLVVVPIKMLTDRAAPHSPRAHAVELFTNDLGWSYPSGHVFNTVIWYPVLAALLGALLRRPVADRTRRLIRVVPVVVVCGTVTYLGFHWLTDAVAGLLLGVVVDRALARVPWEEAGSDGPVRRSGPTGP